MQQLCCSVSQGAAVGYGRHVANDKAEGFVVQLALNDQKVPMHQRRSGLADPLGNETAAPIEQRYINAS